MALSMPNIPMRQLCIARRHVQDRPTNDFKKQAKADYTNAYSWVPAAEIIYVFWVFAYDVASAHLLCSKKDSLGVLARLARCVGYCMSQPLITKADVYIPADSKPTAASTHIVVLSAFVIPKAVRVQHVTCPDGRRTSHAASGGCGVSAACV